MKLNSDLPIKYHMKAHRLCASYPDEMDVLFDIVEHVVSSNKRKKVWKQADIKFKMDEMKNVFPDIGDDNFKEKVRTILSALHKNNNITIVDGETPEDRCIAVTGEGLAKLYTM